MEGSMVRCGICTAQSQQPERISYRSDDSQSTLDFRCPELRGDALASMVQICPVCGYTAAGICRTPPFPKLVRSFLATEEYRRTEGLAFASPLAAAFYRQHILLRDEGNHLSAGYALQCAAWACDDAQDADNAILCRQKATEELEILLDEDFFAEENKLLTLIDLHRRCGNFDRAAALCQSGSVSREYTPLLRLQEELSERRDPRAYTMADAYDRYLIPRLVYCSVQVDGYRKSYSYLSGNAVYAAGDRVIVSFGDSWKAGTVIAVESYDDDEAPYPPERTKTILCRYEALWEGRCDDDLLYAAQRVMASVRGIAESKQLQAETTAQSIVIRNSYGDTSLWVCCEDNIRLCYGEWQQVYDYPAVMRITHEWDEARNEIARKSLSRLIDDLTAFLECRACVVMGYVEESYIGGILKNRRSIPDAALLHEITQDEQLIADAAEKGFHLAERFWSPALDSAKM